MLGSGSDIESDWATWRRVALFVVGAVILLLELEFHSSTRWAVVGLALLLMGAVTFDQLRQWGLLRFLPHHDNGMGKEAPSSPKPDRPD